MGGKGSSSSSSSGFTFTNPGDPSRAAGTSTGAPSPGVAPNSPNSLGNGDGQSFTGAEVSNPTGTMSAGTVEALSYATGSLVGLGLGIPGGGMIGQKVGQSLTGGTLGDITNSRTYESARDEMEQRGISRSDTALAAKHGIATHNSILGDWDDEEGDGGGGSLGGDGSTGSSHGDAESNGF